MNEQHTQATTTTGDVHHGELTPSPREDRFEGANEIGDGGSNEGRDNSSESVFI
jgi:hypothetical protein